MGLTAWQQFAENLGPYGTVLYEGEDAALAGVDALLVVSFLDEVSLSGHI